jgi:hypothetical protein
MSTNVNISPKLVKSVLVTRRIIIYATLLPVVFLLGLVPMWLKSMDASRSLAETERQLSLSQRQINLAAIQTSLDSAVIEAQRSNYEPARQEASNFFAYLRVETDRGDLSALSLPQRDAAQLLLNQQDTIITLLARGDLSSAERLSDLRTSYSKIVNR